MARKRRKHTTHRRRRVSGTNSTDLKAVGVAVLFAIGGRKLSSMLAKSTNTTMASIAPYSELALGIALPMLVKNDLVKQGSKGLLIDGAIQALTKLAPGIVSGPYRLPVVSGRTRLNGGVYSPNMVGSAALNGYSPNRSSAMTDAMSVVSGVGAGVI